MKEKELEELLGALFGEIKVALIETCLHIENNCDVSDLHNDRDKVIYTAGTFKVMMNEKIEHIISSYMQDKGRDGTSEIKEGYCLIDGVLCEERDDMTREELQKIVADFKSYFGEHLPLYEVVKIRRKSFHEDDRHLYMVTAKKKDGTFAVWTSWNALLQTLNHGHYDLLNLEACDRIMSEFYNAEY